MVGDFLDALSPEDILRKLADLTKPFPGVRGIRLLCQDREHDCIVCVVDANRDSQKVAAAISGFIYGGMPARTIAPLPVGFRCPGRHEGKLISAFCARCFTSRDEITGVLP